MYVIAIPLKDLFGSLSLYLLALNHKNFLDLMLYSSKA